MKKVLSVLLAAALMAGCLGLSACGSSGEGAAKDKAVLVVSFGTSFNESRSITIGAIESAIAEAYPDYDVRRAFTAQIIIDKLAERDGIKIDNVKEALDRAAADGIRTLVIQPTHLMNGLEYADLQKEVEEYKDKFDSIVLSEPLLTSDEDYDAVIKAITAKTEKYDDGETAICFMGHGTEAESNKVYSTLQDKITKAGYDNYFIGTVEAEPSLDDVIKAVKKNGEYDDVVLLPLMVVAGDHANNDMAGDEKGTWKKEFEAAGYDVTCVLEGLGQDYNIQKIYLDHLADAMEK